MENKEIRRKILEILYKKDEETFRQYIDRDELKDDFSIDYQKLDSNVLNLRDKGFLEILTASHVYFLGARITTKGKNLIENESELNNQSPVSLTQNIAVHNSSGVVINSHDISMTIEDSFNEIYSQIQDKNPENGEEVEKMVKELEEELNKENINKSATQKISKWLQSNAKWTIPIITQIVTTILTGLG